MAQLVRSAFNRGGNWQSDGLDQGDAARFQRAGQNQDNDLMRQLALAQLQSGDARFAASREDANNESAARYGFMGKQMDQNALFHNQDRADSAAERTADIGYRTGRDKAADDRYNAEWKYDHDPADLKMKNDLNAMQMEKFKRDAATATLDDADRAEQRARAKDARNGALGGIYAPKTQAGKDAVAQASFRGLGAGEASYGAQMADRQAAKDILPDEEAAAADQFKGLHDKENAWFSSPTQDDTNQGVKALQSLIKRYEDAGYEHPIAVRNAATVLKKSYPEIGHIMRKAGIVLGAANPITAAPVIAGLATDNLSWDANAGGARDTLMQALRMKQ